MLVLRCILTAAYNITEYWWYIYYDANITFNNWQSQGVKMSREEKK